MDYAEVDAERACMVMVIMVVVWLVAMRRCVELRLDVAYPSDEDAVVLCDERCGAGGACVQRLKVCPFDHKCMITLISMRSVCAPHAMRSICVLRAVRGDCSASSRCCAPRRTSVILCAHTSAIFAIA